MEKNNYEEINIKDVIEKCYIVATLANEMLTRGCEIAENYPNVNMNANSTDIAIMINDIRNTLCKKMNEINVFLQDIDDMKRLFPIYVVNKCEKEIIQNAAPSISEEFINDGWTYQMIINRKGLGYDRILIPTIKKISFPIYANDISATMDDITKNQVINNKLPIDFLNWFKNKHKDDERRIALYDKYNDYLGDEITMCKYVRITITIEYHHNIIFTLNVSNLFDNIIKDLSVIPDSIYDIMN